MRMMIRWTVPTEQGNEAVEDGTIGTVLGAMTERLSPEAAYYYAESGERAGMMVFDMKHPDEIPQICEPLFRELHAMVEIIPVMNADDLKRALGKISG